MDLEIRHLKLVDMIAREGGLTAASRLLYLTQSALSHQLREIEDRLGTPLFLRVKKRMLLTEAGRLVLKSAQSILAEMQETESAVRRLANGGEGVLRISTQCNTCYHWLPAVIRKFQKRYPRVDVQINVEATSDPFRALWQGKLDLAILYAVPDRKGLSLQPLFSDELMALVHPGNPLVRRNYLRPEDFRDQNLLVYMTPKGESLLFQKVLFPAGIHPAKVTPVMLTEAIVEMVKADLGISVLSRWFIQSYVRDGVVKALRITKKGLVRNWMAAAIANDDAPAYLAEFTRLISKPPKV
jgi:LysR family transcriptional regulator, regulator for metE and metH